MATTKIPVEFLNALSGSEITDGSIGTADIADDAITTAKIAANAITATQLPDNVITATHIPNGLITGTHMAGTTITATQIANNAVGTDQLAGIARGKIIYGDSNGDPQLLALGSNGQVLKSDGSDIAWSSDVGETNRLPLAGGTMTGNLVIGTSGFTTATINSTRGSGNIGGMNFSASGTNKAQVYGTVDGQLKLGTGGDGSADSTVALTLDASQNATFAGTLLSGLSAVTHGSTPYFDLKVGSTMKGRFYADANQAIIEAVGNSLILKSASTTALTFNSSQLAAFTGAATIAGTLGVAGNVTTGNSLILGGNDNEEALLTIRYSTVPTYISSTFDGSDAISAFSTNQYNNDDGSASLSSITNSSYSSAAIKMYANTADSSIRFYTATAANTTPTEYMRVDHDGKVGIGTTSPQAQLDLTVPNAKTANASVYSYLGKTNESSNYGALQLFQIGHANAASRQWQFQTIEQGVANAGIITFQLSGGQVAIGRSTADTKLDVTGDIRASTGIKFGSDTAAANALDDYEEGTWNLTDQSGAGMSLNVYVAEYTKIGNKVFFEIGMQFPTTSSTAEIRLSLPFTAKSTGDNTGGAFRTGTNSGRADDMYLVLRNTALMSMGNLTNNSGAADHPRNDDYSGKQLKLAGFYTAA